MIVIKTSIFPASKDEVFNKLQKLKLLQYIAWPYATFTPVGEKISVWLLIFEEIVYGKK